MPVHSPWFPGERFEQWMVLLVDVKSNKLVGYQKLSQNSRFEKVQLKFLAPKEGVVHYEIHCLCSAYLGVDKKVLMKKTIVKRKQEEVRASTSTRSAPVAMRQSALHSWHAPHFTHPPHPPTHAWLPDQTKSAAELAEDEDDEEEEEEEEPEGKWYYLGGNSVGELILNIIALAIAGVMLFNFLYSRGLWQRRV